MRLEDYDIAPQFRSCPDCHTTTGEHDAGCPSALDDEINAYEQRRQYERREVERASDTARQRMQEDADLHRRAAQGDVPAAQEIVRRVFQRYQQAMQDGTEGEKKGWQAELAQACARYNVLAGHLTTEAVA